MNAAARAILHELRQQGVLPFARFMELALYCPLCGYYEQEADKPGRRGDYFTSVSVGGLFGELLACQFATWLSGANAGRPGEDASPFVIVEAGAHDGKLAHDILGWMQQYQPTVFGQLEYRIVEPSERRQAWQRRTLATFRGKVRWFAGLAALRRAELERSAAACSAPDGHCLDGILFSNELLDAMPVRRLGWDAQARAWFEWGVGFEDGKFVWTRLTGHVAPSCFAIPVPDALLAVLPDGFTTEVCPAATDWWRQAAQLLRRGKLMTLDYGMSALEFFAPERRNGTLRAYHLHRCSSEVLTEPGERDLTAHVNFTALQATGEEAGLATEDFLTQAQFLVRIAEQTWQGRAGSGEWDAGRKRQFKTLTHPEHLGRPFRVLVQGRDD